MLFRIHAGRFIFSFGGAKPTWIFRQAAVGQTACARFDPRALILLLLLKGYRCEYGEGVVLEETDLQARWSTLGHQRIGA